MWIGVPPARIPLLYATTLISAAKAGLPSTT
jgi:hypothetical protein